MFFDKRSFNMIYHFGNSSEASPIDDFPEGGLGLAQWTIPRQEAAGLLLNSIL